jgi:hypothetical protein
LNPYSREIKSQGKWVMEQKIVDIIYVQENQLLWLATENKITIVDALNPKDVKKEIELAPKVKVWKLHLLPFENSKIHVKKLFYLFYFFNFFFFFLFIFLLFIYLFIFYFYYLFLNLFFLFFVYLFLFIFIYFYLFLFRYG